MNSDNSESGDEKCSPDSNLEDAVPELTLSKCNGDDENAYKNIERELHILSDTHITTHIGSNMDESMGHIATWLGDSRMQCELDGTSPDADSVREYGEETNSSLQRKNSIGTWFVDDLITVPEHNSEKDNDKWFITNNEFNTTEQENWLEQIPLLEKEDNKSILVTSESTASNTKQRHLTFSCPKGSKAFKEQYTSTVTVKFFLDDGQVYTKAYKQDTKIQEIKESLARVFNIPVQVISIGQVSEEQTLAEMEIKQYGIVEMKCVSMDPESYPILLSNVYDDMKVPDVINVTVHLSGGAIKEVVVEIDNQCVKKPWMGGYCNRKTGEEFHHAFSQTHPRSTCMRAHGKAHRDTQTTQWSTRDQNTFLNKSTQMSQTSVYIPCIHDRAISPQPYVTFDDIQREKNVLNKVVIIQRHIRGWLARKITKKMRKDFFKEEITSKQMGIMREMNAKNNPRTRADFDMLYNMVERWRQTQVAEVQSQTLKGAEICRILEKEILILSSIERHRIRVREEKLAQKEFEFLEKSSQPITWTGNNGQTITMDTIGTQRARELKEMFNSLCNYDVEPEARVNRLLSLKHALKSYNCEKVAEIITLMDKECDCLMRGLKSNQLDVLRTRLRSMFFSFVKDPKCNPDISCSSRVFNSEGNTIFCGKCRKILPLTKFQLNSCSKTMKYCTSCNWIENIAHTRRDLRPYACILSTVRKEEQKRCCFTSVAFVMQDEDIYHLVVNIWHSQSAISKSTDLNDLCLSRWNLDKHWAPWNCILLNKTEAKIHNASTKTLDKVYEAEFIESIHLKHLEAQIHFQWLASMDTQLCNTVDM